MKKLILLNLLVFSLSFAQSNLPLKRMLDSYLAIKNALVASDANLASQRAKQFLNLTDSIQIETPKNSNDSIWVVYQYKINSDAKHIYETKKIDQQREHFNTFSNNLFLVFKHANSNDYVIYQQFCPMADGGKGSYWISELASIKNPYFGKTMLNCGKTISTLNPKKSQ
jgi:hypothetical protein